MIARGGANPGACLAGLLSWPAGGYALVVFLLAGPALAEAPPLPGRARLEYALGAGTKSCAGEKELRSAVRSQVDHEVFASDAPARMRVTLSRRPKDGQYEAALDLHDGGGRMLRHQSIPPMVRCPDVVQAAAVVIAEMLDPIRPEPPAAQPAPPPPPTLLAAESPRAAEPDRLELRAGLSAWLGLGIAPRPAVGLSGDFGLRWSPISLSAELRWDPPARADVGGGARLATRRLLGALVPCGHWSRESFGLFGCGVVQMGKIWGIADGIPGASAIGEPVFAVGGRIGIELRLSPITPHLALRLSGELMPQVQRGTFVLNTQARWETPAIAGGLGLGVVAVW